MAVMKADTSLYPRRMATSTRPQVKMKAKIPEEAKAFGSIPKRFVVSMTPEGPRVDVVV